MKNLKKAMAVGLAAMAAVSAMSVTALANGELVNHEATNTVDETVMRANPYMNVSISDLAGNDSERYLTFDTTYSEPYAKIWIGNDSTGYEADLYTVYITTPNGTVRHFTATSNGGQNYMVFDGSTYGIGEYSVTISNNHSYGFTGLVSVRTSANPLK